MPSDNKSSCDTSSYTTTHNAISMLSWSRRSKVSTCVYSRINGQTLSTTNYVSANSATNNTIPLLSWFNRSKMPSTDISAYSATHHPI